MTAEFWFSIYVHKRDEWKWAHTTKYCNIAERTCEKNYEAIT